MKRSAAVNFFGPAQPLRMLRMTGVAALLGLAGSDRLAAQERFAVPPNRPGFFDERPLNLVPENPPLPPLDVLLPRVGEQAFPPLEIRVTAFAFEGNTVCSNAELAAVVAPFSGRTITAEELEQARLAVTAHYIGRGYVNSGAVLGDQEIDRGVITFTIVEGRLSDIEVRGNRWLRSRYIARRLERRSGPPLNVHGIQEALLLLNDHAVIEKVNADLQPAGKPGESRLVVNVKERFPLHAGLEFSNDRPASVGAEHLDFVASDQSLTGNGDLLDARLTLLNRTKSGAETGFENFAVSYALPLNSWDTTLRLAYSQNDYAIIEEPFLLLDISGRSHEYEVSLRQPLYRTFQTEFALSLTGARRHSETFLRGEPFTLAPGAVDGETDVTVIRFAQEWSRRTQSQVIALRSSLNFGIRAFGATDNGTDRDAEFFSWLGQVQYIQRFGQHGVQLILRGDFQWTPDQLLTLEQFSIGGIDSVRGYRENQLVRDKAVVGTAELRVPLWSNGRGKPVLQVAAFYDIGAGWNNDEPTPAPGTISSIGAGLIFTPNERISAELYWAHRLTEIANVGERDLQDDGFHFRVTVLAF